MYFPSCDRREIRNRWENCGHLFKAKIMQNTNTHIGLTSYIYDRRIENIFFVLIRSKATWSWIVFSGLHINISILIVEFEEIHLHVPYSRSYGKKLVWCLCNVSWVLQHHMFGIFISMWCDNGDVMCFEKLYALHISSWNYYFHCTFEKCNANIDCTSNVSPIVMHSN